MIHKQRQNLKVSLQILRELEVTSQPDLLSEDMKLFQAELCALEKTKQDYAQEKDCGSAQAVEHLRRRLDIHGEMLVSQRRLQDLYGDSGQNDSAEAFVKMPFETDSESETSFSEENIGEGEDVVTQLALPGQTLQAPWTRNVMLTKVFHQSFNSCWTDTTIPPPSTRTYKGTVTLPLCERLKMLSRWTKRRSPRHYI